MIKIIIFIFFLSSRCFAQDLFIDKEKNEYIFIGSHINQQIKLLKLEDKSIVWLDENSLEQLDRLSSFNFFNHILDAKIFFSANSDEPFWKATINKNKIIFTQPDGDLKEIKINVDVNEFTIDSEFLLMFQSSDPKNIYGIIRGLTNSTFCDFNFNEEQSIFEVFINYKGQNFKGCAILTL